MYSIYADGVCIYNDVFTLDLMKLTNPKLTLSDNSAGSLSLTLPPSNIGYNTIARMTTEITVKKDGDEIWAGRVLSESKDFWNNRTILCEGELAYLNDSIQPQAEYHDVTVEEFLSTLIAVHNSKVAENKQFEVGIVTVTDSNNSLYRYTNYETTMTCISDKLIDRLGGHVRVRKENGVRYLDYLADYPNANSQTIEFGKNLLDFTRNWDATDFATVIVPLGNRLDESPIEALEAYLTVEEVNNGSPYVLNEDSLAEFGWIETVVRWEDVTTASALLTKAQDYLSNLQFDNMVLELSALDMHYLVDTYESIKLLDKIRVISYPHGMDRYFPVTKLEIPLDEPENTQFTLGDAVQETLTSSNRTSQSEILQRIESLPKYSSLLEEAKANATELMNQATTGYITISQDDFGSDAMYISDDRDYTKATKLWKWNLNGLGYSNDGGETYGLAITMDGSIVADYITSGTLNANLIRAGILEDVNSNVIFDLEAGTLTIKDGSIDLGDGNFSVSTNGYLNSKTGQIAGWTITNNKLYTGDGDTVGVCVVQAPTESTTWVFAAGGTTHTTYTDCPFRVSKAGKLYATDAEITGKIVASSGTIGRWNVSTTENFGTSDDGGHAYRYGLWGHSGDGTYEYEVGMKIDGGNSTTSNSGNLAFYVKRITAGGTWDSTTNMFYVTRAGKLYATNAEITGKITATSGSFTGTVNATDGSFTGTVTSSNATITGGSINIESSSESVDVIRLKYGDNLYSYMSPAAIGVYNTASGTKYAAMYGTSVVVYDSSNTARLTSSGVTTSSDRQLKEDINYITGEEYVDFVRALKPCTFRFTGAEDENVGFIAQDVAEAMKNAGVVFQGYRPPTEDDPYCSLNYAAFVSPIVSTLQNVLGRLDRLESAIN